jgi:hypothetical protein
LKCKGLFFLDAVRGCINPLTEEGRQPGFLTGGENSRQDEGFCGVRGDKKAFPEEVTEKGLPGR